MEGVRSNLFVFMKDSDWQVAGDGPYYALDGGSGIWRVSSEGATVSRSGTEAPQMGVWKIVASPEGTLLVDDHYFTGG